MQADDADPVPAAAYPVQGARPEGGALEELRLPDVLISREHTIVDLGDKSVDQNDSFIETLRSC